MAELVLRHCVAADLEHLEWNGLYRHDRPIIEAVYARTLAGRAAMIVAERAGAVVGQIWIDLACEDGAAKLWALRVKPECRRRGIGAVLIGAAEAASSERALRAAEIEVEAENADARRLYERVGYTLARRDPSTGLLVMVKELVAPPT